MSALVQADRIAGWVAIAITALVIGISLKTATPGLETRTRSAGHTSRDAEMVRLASLDPTGAVPATPRRPLATTQNEPFGRLTFPAADGALWRKWQTAETEINAEADILAGCRFEDYGCPDAARTLLDIVEEARRQEGRSRIGTINRSINLAIRPVSDLAQFGVSDLWTSPLTTLGSGRGDCEDYAIAKYLALREAGVAAHDLRLVIVRDTLAKEDHAILAARLADQWLILDNRHHALVDSTEMRYFTPLFALDQEGVRHFATGLAQQAVERGGSEASPARADTMTYLQVLRDEAAAGR